MRDKLKIGANVSLGLVNIGKQTRKTQVKEHINRNTKQRQIHPQTQLDLLLILPSSMNFI